MKSSKYKYQLIVGYREEQRYTIDANELHKAYYLFLNPEARAIFSNGVAVIGKNIMGIEPNFNATMGWNDGHKLSASDHAELKEKGISDKMRNIQSAAKDSAYLPNAKEFLNEPFGEIVNQLGLVPQSINKLSEQNEK